MQYSVLYKTQETIEWNHDRNHAGGPTANVGRYLMNSKRPYATDDSRWQAVVDRDLEARGHFLYGVKTTGIYCRPGCASRLPRRENVRFFDDAQTAEAAGFRPCKRCTPQIEPADPAVKAVIQACRMIEEAEQPPSLDELADAAGFSKYHFHRLFKRIVGVTPAQYAAEKRSDRLRGELQTDSAVTDAIYNAGYESSSRFYETAVSSLGMKPMEYRDGGPGVSIRYAIRQTYLGLVLIAATERGICRIDFGDTQQGLLQRLRENFPRAKLQADDPQFAATVNQVLAFLDRPQEGLDLPLDIQGTAFQRRVWDALRDIPAGKTISYGDLAREIGRPKASRAVAGACAANQIAVAVPCHRVVRGGGGLGGYRWGLARKEAILEREAE
ncbi:MAG: bifunctional DNA-binding transcriptional regulator/O6-methylguanine-DNA methyltransferase Ada [Candidatus Promineifilaceae bacterium]|jgi:AraC family transcriptional regulator of adaptative response/methylated-DNA-[protein]-cysteine methyltransferase